MRSAGLEDDEEMAYPEDNDKNVIRQAVFRMLGKSVDL